MPHTRKELLSWAKDAWEKITGKHKEEEVTLKGWVARDESNILCLFHGIAPEKDDNGKLWLGGDPVFLDNASFSSVQWSDPEPTLCEITIKIKKNYDNSINQKEIF